MACARPAVNVQLGRFEVDLLWREHRLVVELDGYASHGTRAAFERDRSRDAELAAAGLRIVRFTWRQVARDPAAVAARMRTLLRDVCLAPRVDLPPPAGGGSDARARRLQPGPPPRTVPAREGAPGDHHAFLD